MHSRPTNSRPFAGVQRQREPLVREHRRWRHRHRTRRRARGRLLDARGGARVDVTRARARSHPAADRVPAAVLRPHRVREHHESEAEP